MNLSLPSIFGCPYTHPIQEIFRTEKYFLFSRIFTLSISWFGDLYLKKSIIFSGSENAWQ